MFDRLFDQAERVRWQLADIAWDRIDRTQVTPPLIDLVTEIAFSELTTATATRRFLTELADDAELTQWIAVWFYEETKHPQVLLRWLAQVGVSVDDEFFARGKATAPFMRSRIGTLVTNVISELAASAAYANLAARTTEPVLASIARNLAGDEARHAASFYEFARRHLERSPDPDGDRRDALKVVYLWLQDNAQITHPVNEFYARNRGVMTELGFDARLPRDRITRLIGTLVGLPISADADVREFLRGEHHETT